MKCKCGAEATYARLVAIGDGRVVTMFGCHGCDLPEKLISVVCDMCTNKFTYALWCPITHRIVAAGCDLHRPEAGRFYTPSDRLRRVRQGMRKEG